MPPTDKEYSTDWKNHPNVRDARAKRLGDRTSSEREKEKLAQCAYEIKCALATHLVGYLKPNVIDDLSVDISRPQEKIYTMTISSPKGYGTGALGANIEARTKQQFYNDDGCHGSTRLAKEEPNGTSYTFTANSLSDILKTVNNWVPDYPIDIKALLGKGK